MLTLITFPAGFGALSFSPFCVKAIYLLNAAHVPWRREDINDPRRMPRGKLPVLRTPEGLVHDSGSIRQFLERKGADFSAGLSPQEKAQGHAFVRMVEEHLYFLLLLDRWEKPEAWAILRSEYFGSIPGLLRGVIAGTVRRRILNGLRVQGLGTMTDNERIARADEDLTAIAGQLGNQRFLFGDAPTLADYSVVPMLDALRSPPVETPLSRRVRDDVRLAAYVDRGAAKMAPP